MLVVLQKYLLAGGEVSLLKTQDGGLLVLGYSANDLFNENSPSGVDHAELLAANIVDIAFSYGGGAALDDLGEIHTWGHAGYAPETIELLGTNTLEDSCLPTPNINSGSGRRRFSRSNLTKPSFLAINKYHGLDSNGHASEFRRWQAYNFDLNCHRRPWALNQHQLRS